MLVASQIICETFSMSQGHKPNLTLNIQHLTFKLRITDIKRTRNGKRIVQFSL